ncbi:MAG TPA: hypothetical protein DC047_12685 [Blastocatellia bacterium]|nr:hypothetical protein [Blastocatellia bacterium]
MRRHGIDFVDAEIVFAGETVTLLDDRFDYGEKRFLTLGLLWGRVVAISHTERSDGVRIISFRRALKNEQEIYFKEIRN